MNNSSLDRQLLEANLGELRRRVPDLPVSSIMLSRLILRLGRGMAAILEHEIRPSGLTEVEFRVLTTLFAQPDGATNPTDLCSKTSLSPATMSRISDALVGRNLITRVSSLDDRRKMLLRITEGGEQLVRRLLPNLFVPLREVFQDGSEQDQLALIEQLLRLGARMDQALSRHAPERVA